MSPSTVCEAFQATAVSRPEAVALRTVGDEAGITWREYGERVRRIAIGLAARGVRRGDVVALMLRNRPEFNLVDMAVLHLGATPFSIYNTSPPEQIVYLFADAGAKLVITEDVFLGRILAVREQTALDQVVTVDDARDGAVALAEIEAEEGSLDFEAAWRAVRPDDVLTIIYTSGTTGPAKGVELTHANQLAMAQAWMGIMPLDEGARLLSYLPSAHGVDRLLTHYLGVLVGATITSLADAKQLAAGLLDTRPTAFLGVPRVWEKFQAALEAAISANPDEASRAAVLGAIEVGRRKVRAEQAALDGTGAGPDEALLAEYAGVDTAVLASLRAMLGLDGLTAAGVGAAPSSREMLEFFHAIGIPVLEGWGMTELSGISTANPLHAPKLGTVGRLLPGVELKVADDGELLVRGPVVMRGYRNAPDKTAETIDADGWVHTGDIGDVDEQGYVRIVDRKKELIINAAGKNMSPANIEAALKGSSPLIGQCVCVGDRRPYNVALIVLDPDTSAAYAKANGLDGTSPAALAADPGVVAAVAEAVERANAKLARIEQIKRHVILPADWLPDSDELTPTMKLKRKPIAAKYAEQIEALYAAQA